MAGKSEFFLMPWVFLNEDPSRHVYVQEKRENKEKYLCVTRKSKIV